MDRFLISPDRIDDRIVSIDKDQAHHIERVKRLKKGDIISGFDGQGYEYEICLLGKENGVLLGEVKNIKYSNTEPDIHLALIQGIAKGDKMDMIIQKAVEIGISSVYPVLTDNCVVKLSLEKSKNKVRRWNIIAREACKQCRRAVVPVVSDVKDLKEIYKDLQGQKTIMLYENEKSNFKKTLNEQKNEIKDKKINLIVGPEGGFSEGEVSEALGRGVITAGLGPRILRTETAGLVAGSIILYELGELG